MLETALQLGEKWIHRLREVASLNSGELVVSIESIRELLFPFQDNRTCFPFPESEDRFLVSEIRGLVICYQNRGGCSGMSFMTDCVVGIPDRYPS